ncbi:regulator of RNase E activity RraA [Novosphingobium chloroacetimidivorans]|uniref:Putative 4-hydroxy-4-methyl-2-oxoglutarate aldolase n=1 Tax=Novosphingobium chloroacetimidivorans TaxID=1428314 RepID=A0A7W7NVT6_9SPHN|nr:RraA family protein [Novosphingobium chloroacetimidivorans]MBB4858636.1 regulator of RNase E activity RraA [Novosphingobium chloroacetimidivorans]
MTDVAAIAATLATIPASVIAEATGGRGVVAPGLIRFAGSGTVAGRAVTARCDEAALQSVFQALEASAPGDILCYNAPGLTAYLGDLLAADIVSRGLVGAVVDGHIRDRASVAKLPLSIFARGTNPYARRGPGGGEAMIPIEIGGAKISPGDWVIGDDDGVVVVAPDEIEAAIATAQESLRMESRIRARIAAGEKVREAVQAEVAAARQRAGG